MMGQLYIDTNRGPSGDPYQKGDNMALNQMNGKSDADKKAYRWSKTTYLHPKNYADVQFGIRLSIAVLKKLGLTDEDIKKIKESKE